MFYHERINNDGSSNLVVKQQNLKATKGDMSRSNHNFKSINKYCHLLF